MLFTSVALPGHLFPLVPLAWASRCLGHEVLIATTENFVPVAARTGLPVCSFGPPGGIDDLLRTDVTTQQALSGQRYAHGRAFAAIAARNLAGMRTLAHNWRPDLVVSERAEFAGALVAAELGIRRAELHWGVAPLTEYLDALRSVVGEVPPPAADLLNPWPPSLRPSYAAGHRSVRHVPYNGDATLPPWLFDTPRRPRICLTLGTVLPALGNRDVSAFMVELVRELAKLGVEIVIAVDDAVAAGWPVLPDAVVHAGRVPMAQALTGAALALNHGGQGTTLTALSVGCPQVLLPQFDDQFDNADAVVKSGAGLRLLPDETTVASVVRACAEVLHNPVFATAAAAATAEMAAQPGPVEIAASLCGP